MRISDWSSDVCSSDLIRWTSSRAAIIGGRASVQIRMKADAKPITPAQTTAHVTALDSSPTRPQAPISATAASGPRRISSRDENSMSTTEGGIWAPYGEGQEAQRETDTPRGTGKTPEREKRG